MYIRSLLPAFRTWNIAQSQPLNCVKSTILIVFVHRTFQLALELLDSQIYNFKHYLKLTYTHREYITDSKVIDKQKIMDKTLQAKTVSQIKEDSPCPAAIIINFELSSWFICWTKIIFLHITSSVIYYNCVNFTSINSSD